MSNFCPAPRTHPKKESATITDAGDDESIGARRRLLEKIKIGDRDPRMGLAEKKMRIDGSLRPATSGQTRPHPATRNGGVWRVVGEEISLGTDKCGQNRTRRKSMAAFAGMRVGDRVRILANAATGHGGRSGSSAFWRMQLRDSAARQACPNVINSYHGDHQGVVAY
jgi:hypothetical protein